MKATAAAPANIAFIKYWGRKDAKLRIPYNSSISMNLSASTTTTTVEFSKVFSKDRVELVEEERFSDTEIDRVVRQLDVIRGKAGKNIFARVATKNSFPKSSGAASSASGFAALTTAAIAALGLTLSEKELTILARLGSGSACRSIPHGFVRWETGNTSEDSYAHSLFPANHWDLRSVLVIVKKSAKDVSSTAGHDKATTSPLFSKRLQELPKRMEAVMRGLKEKNLSLLGPAIEEETLSMHGVMQTQTPPLFYWTDATKHIMEQVARWRKKDLPVYFTIDAGPNVHLICESQDEKKVLNALQSIGGIESIIVNKPAQGARLIKDHLF